MFDYRVVLALLEGLLIILSPWILIKLIKLIIFIVKKSREKRNAKLEMNKCALCGGEVEYSDVKVDGEHWNKIDIEVGKVGDQTLYKTNVTPSDEGRVRTMKIKCLKCGFCCLETETGRVVNYDDGALDYGRRLSEFISYSVPEEDNKLNKKQLKKVRKLVKNYNYFRSENLGKKK